MACAVVGEISGVMCHTVGETHPQWRAMKGIMILVPALVLSTAAFATEDLTLWGCKQGGERRNVLYLADRGTDSYVKVGPQRVDAQLSTDDGERRWTFGSNHVSLAADGLAEYYEGDVLKGRFRCQAME